MEGSPCSQTKLNNDSDQVERGLPTDNAWIESFSGTLRDACLNVHWFDDWTDAQRKLQAWQREYNDTRPHRSLNELSPQEFKALWAKRTSEIR